MKGYSILIFFPVIITTFAFFFQVCVNAYEWCKLVACISLWLCLVCFAVLTYSTWDKASQMLEKNIDLMSSVCSIKSGDGKLHLVPFYSFNPCKIQFHTYWSILFVFCRTLWENLSIIQTYTQHNLNKHKLDSPEDLPVMQ